MTGVVKCGLIVLLFDAGLWFSLWAALVLYECSTCGGLAGAWAFGAAKWAVLHVFTSTLTDGKRRAVLCRLAALLCLLFPVFESGRVLVAPPSEPYTGPYPDLSVLLLVSGASSLACVVWEKACGDGTLMKLLVRLLKYFKPDTLYLIAAFGFLILGVVCEYDAETETS